MASKKTSKKVDSKPEVKKELTDRQKATEVAINQIKERFGEGSIMMLREAKKMEVEAISTGCLSLDLALGIGGLPRGRVIEIFGKEMSGKSTLALHVIAEAQKKGGVAAFVDAEHALDPEYAKRIGVKVNDLLISQPDTGEQALEIVETLVRSNGIDVIVIDSVAALTPKKEIEGEMGDSHMGLQARLMSQALRKLTAIVSKSKASVIFINQVRMKIGVFFGNPETTTGGLALKFYSSVRVELKRLAQIKKKDDVIGNKVKAKIAKNKVAPPFKTCEFEIMYNQGISWEGDLLNLGAKYDLVKKSGNTLSYEETKLGVGWENSKQALRDNPKLAKELKKKILKAIKEEQKS
ncbi:recombinase RecA [Patescibacteria group bacterium]|nr:recombinase RecA [Patescibacteria group bacterium]